MKSLKLLTLSLVSLLAVSLSSCNKNKSNKDDKSGEEQTSENTTSSTNPGDNSSEPYIPQPGDIDAANIGPDKSVTIADIVNNHVYTDNYYSDISSSASGDNLKNALFDLIKGHTIRSYNNLEYDMLYTDRDWNRSPNVNDENPYMILIYFTANNDTSKQQLWNHYHTSVSKHGIPEAEQSWDKEHIWAKSNGIGSSTALGYSDLHHLRASDMHNNNTRSSLPEADVTGTKSYVTDFTGANSGAKGKNGTTDVYEPYSIFKGDVARALLYMAVRYKSNLSLTDGTNSSGGKWGFLSNLIKWHLEDPADEFEIKRNSLVQYFQGNRNPFIDHPEYACKIYSGVGGVSSVCNSH